jgi:diadenylate cyclase
MRTIAVFAAEKRYVLEDSAALLARTHTQLDTLERYRRRLDDVTRVLTALEIEDRATATDIALVAQQLEMVTRVTDEIAGYLVELGTDAGLLRLQLDELTAGTRRQRELLLRDYEPDPSGPAADAGAPTRADRLAALGSDTLADLLAVAAAIGLPGSADPARQVSPRGYRLLGQISRLPPDVSERLIKRFGGLQKLLSASAQDLRQVPGVDPAVAATIRNGLSRIAEAALLERYP